MKKVMPFLLAIVCLFNFSGCENSPVEERFCDSLAQAEEIIGFELEAADSLNNSTSQNFRVSGRTLEIMYFSGKVLNGRISKADNSENIDGNHYGYTEIIKINDKGIEYILYGDEGSDVIHFATWTKGAYSYSVLDGAGKDIEEMVLFCKSVK